MSALDPRRSPGWYVLAALTLLLGFVVVRFVTCGRWPRGDVAMPPATAGPMEVVTAYVAALDEHDVGTAKALSTPEMVEFTDGAGGWYHGTASITDLVVREPIVQGPDSGGTRAGDREAVWVPVQFDLDQCLGDGTLPDGEMGWGYLLSRESPTSRWLVTDEGH